MALPEPASAFAEKASAGRTEPDELTVAERFGELFAIGAMFLVAAFFLYHELKPTGFFTAAFGPLEQTLFWLPLALGIAAASSRAVLGSRNAVRPIEMTSNAITVAAALWLLAVFPFQFGHLADALPVLLRPLLSWVTNPIGQILLALAALGGLVGLVDVTRRYYGFRSRIRAAIRRAPTA